MNHAPPAKPQAPSAVREPVPLGSEVRIAGCPRYRSEILFGGANEVQIEHDAQLYRLRRTALGKLILTK